jgi:hypothetical protein
MDAADLARLAFDGVGKNDGSMLAASIAAASSDTPPKDQVHLVAREARIQGLWHRQQAS